MSHCLGERALLDLHGGEGTAAARSHVATCAACEARLEALGTELALVRTALTTGPMPRATRPRSAPLVRWTPVAAAATLVLALGLARLGGAPSAGPRGAAAATPELSVVGEALFTDDELAGVATAETDDERVAVLDAALRGDWPCVEATGFAGTDCE